MATRRKLEEKVAIITGSSAGIGEMIAVQFASEGALLSITGRNKEALDNVAVKCKTAGAKEPVITVGDISDETTLQSIVRNTLDAYGRIDILVNNAGVSQVNNLLYYNMESYDNVLAVNLRAPYLLTALCAPHLMKTKGSIVNISSTCSSMPTLFDVPYNLSKAGLDMLTKCTAKELAPHGVRANAVNSGFVHTTIVKRMGVSEENELAIVKAAAVGHALGRIGTVQEISNAVTFLASDEASFITGATLPVDGGILVHQQTANVNHLLQE